MNINDALKQACGEIRLRAMGADSNAAKDIIGKCQAMLDSGEVKQLSPWEASAEDQMLTAARRGLEEIVLKDWMGRYSADDMQTMCRLLELCPDYVYTKVTIIDGLTLTVSEIVRRYNEVCGENITLTDPDIG